MNGKFKYIIVDRDGIELAILVPTLVLHNQAVNVNEVKIVAAGFCEFVEGRISATGRSTSLDIGSRPQDAEVIFCTLMLAGERNLVRPQLSRPSSSSVLASDDIAETDVSKLSRAASLPAPANFTPGLTDRSGDGGLSSEGVHSTDAATDTGRAPAPALSLSAP